MNLTRFLSFTKYALLVAVVLVSPFFISSCDEDDGPKTFNGTTLELISDTRFKQSATVSADVALDSLVKYVNIYPELTAVLSGSNHTLFAPSNTAFINLLALPGFPADIRQINPDLVKGVLFFHIVAEKKLKKDLTSGVVLNSMFTDPLSPSAAQTITVNADGTLLAAPTSANTAIDIVKADNLATNGVVHVVESVLIPTSTGAVLTPILGTTAGTILLGKDFTYLAFMISYADNTVATASKVSSILANPINPTTNPNGITVFAPVNAVFEGAYNAANGQPATNKPTAAQVQGFITAAWTGGSATSTSAVTLKNHIVMGKYVVTAASGATTFSTGPITSLAGVTLTVLTGTTTNPTTNPYGVVITSPSNPVSQAPIVKKDLLHNNGYVQVVAGILKPQ